MATILERIKAYKLEEIAEEKGRCPWASLELAASEASPPRGFIKALKEKRGQVPALIAEIKKASPSKGLIRADFNPAAHAADYEAGGAACLSVLTDGPSFQGARAHLIAARSAVSLPVLRKDFLYDPYQVVQARAMGADCILIIMASVSDAEARALLETANEWGMDTLVEVHNAPELTRALALDAELIGINNRDLHSFVTTLEVTETLAPTVPKDRFLVSESGIFTPEDVARVARAGAGAILVGESLMRQADVKAATQTLLTPEPAA